MPGFGRTPRGWITLLCGFVAGATLCCMATATATAAAMHNQQALDNKLSSLEHIVLLSTQPTVTEDLCAKITLLAKMMRKKVRFLLSLGGRQDGKWVFSVSAILTINEPDATYHLWGPEEWVRDSSGLVGLTVPDVHERISSSQPDVLGIAVLPILLLRKRRQKEVNNCPKITHIY